MFVFNHEVAGSRLPGCDILRIRDVYRIFPGVVGQKSFRRGGGERQSFIEQQCGTEALFYVF